MSSSRSSAFGRRRRCGVLGTRTLDDRLDILRIVVDAADDDQILDAPADKELSLVQEAEVSRAEVAMAGTVVRDCDLEGLSREIRPIPVAAAFALPVKPDLPDPILAEICSEVGIHDAEFDPLKWLPAADQLDLVVVPLLRQLDVQRPLLE